MANDDSATIEALTNKLAEAFNAGDFAAVGAMYANDAVICPPNSNIVTGKGNIQSFWERKRMIQGMSFKSISIKPLGESAFRTVGTLSLKVGRQNAGPRAARRHRMRSMPSTFSSGRRSAMSGRSKAASGTESGRHALPAYLRLPLSEQVEWVLAEVLAAQAKGTVDLVGVAWDLAEVLAGSAGRAEVSAAVWGRRWSSWRRSGPRRWRSARHGTRRRSA